ncbi:PHA/PHB synthase family protein [Agarilytica rhodophyticola]|uniref:PHA/PHB synthase family protein n=1 Tax=Agarilytica rhodophyticola TaxID=1737490 RepID=UPI000B343B9E|nr:class I poly(R)-hydroxyalkanoic acid synthase [Agarilytica rhodophyticola]
MNQEEKHQVLDYIDKFSTVFNSMMQEVTKRIVNQQNATDLDRYLNTDFDPQELASKVQVNPKKFVEQQLAFMEKQQQLWQNASKAFMGEEFAPVISEPKGDKRFGDDDWQGNPGFNYLKQAYLLNAEYMHQLVDVLEFEDKKVEQQVRFYTRQFINSLSPSNYVLTNPEVCREILTTQGENLAKGIDNFMHDLERSPNEAFKITQVAEDAFQLGEQLAYTPGDVVFENHLIQLIQYKATTSKVFEVPLLIVPPFINKYYILDLDEKKSLVKWLVDQGYTVFMISWVNPDDSYRSLPFDDYINKGVIAALDAVQDISKSKTVNATGYCVGGTVLAMTQAYLAAKNDKRIHSLTFFTTLLDFSEPGEVGNYISEHTLPMLEQTIESKGYFDGRILALSFSMLRENNLFWSFFIENYLKGKDPTPFDILYWNSDSTNVPAEAFLFYLKNMYMENRLVEAGGITINDTPIDLSKIDTSCYCLAAQADHIVLWQSAFQGAKKLPEDTRFVMTESGHVAGVINPIDKGKYPHWINDSLPETPEEWLEKATRVKGSWWGDWHAWLSARSGDKRKARSIGNRKYSALEDAPGQYVKRRLDTL